MAFTRDHDETEPTDETFVKDLDDLLRYLQVDVAERLKYLFYGFVAGENAEECSAKQIHFKEQASIGSPGEGYGILRCKAVLGKCELFWKDEDNNEKQLTTGGKLNVEALEAVLLTGNQTITGNKTFAAILASANLDIGDWELRAKVLESDVATGTAPVKGASTTKVSNLNADAVDGLHIEKYDSGWFAATVDTTYTKAHGLSGAPNVVHVYYSDTADGSGDVVKVGHTDFAQMVTTYHVASNVCDIDATNVKLRTDDYLAIYHDAAGAYKSQTTGYLKIVAVRVF